jgi:predicted DNA-binding protein
MSSKKAKINEKFSIFCRYNLYMAATSFVFPDEFKTRLDELSQAAGKNRTQYVIEAVNRYAAGTMPDKIIISRIDALTADTAKIKEGMENITALCIRIIKDQNQSL